MPQPATSAAPAAVTRPPTVVAPAVAAPAARMKTIGQLPVDTLCKTVADLSGDWQAINTRTQQLEAVLTNTKLDAKSRKDITGTQLPSLHVMAKTLSTMLHD